MKEFKAHLPPDIRLSVWYDQSMLINASVASVRDAMIIGVLLAIAVLLLFLRNWRITLVVAIAVLAANGLTTRGLAYRGE